MPRIAVKASPLALRLALHGCTNRPFFHFVVMNKKAARNAKPKEQIGTYDPMPNTENERLMAVNFERLKYYLAVGAEPTKPVLQLLGLAGFLPVHPMSYILAQRRRKEAAALKENKTEEAAES